MRKPWPIRPISDCRTFWRHNRKARHAQRSPARPRRGGATDRPRPQPCGAARNARGGRPLHHRRIADGRLGGTRWPHHRLPGRSVVVLSAEGRLAHVDRGRKHCRRLRRGGLDQLLGRSHDLPRPHRYAGSVHGRRQQAREGECRRDGARVQRPGAAARRQRDARRDQQAGRFECCGAFQPCRKRASGESEQKCRGGYRELPVPDGFFGPRRSRHHGRRQFSFQGEPGRDDVQRSADPRQDDRRRGAPCRRPRHVCPRCDECRAQRRARGGRSLGARKRRHLVQFHGREIPQARERRHLRPRYGGRGGGSQYRLQRQCRRHWRVQAEDGGQSRIPRHQRGFHQGHGDERHGQ